ncbi:MAG: hypothetical protein ED557_11635 [Balneola sp.]|nr:MAG: hypothetical protein ED557_11635 [Balneola sp.]
MSERLPAFYKNFLKMVGGTGVAQLIPFLVSPILTRIFTPDEFGAYAFFLASISVMTIIATGKYELAFLIPKEKRRVFSLVAFSTGLAIVVSSVLFIILYFFGARFFESVDLENYSSAFIYGLPIAVLIVSLTNILSGVMIRLKQFSKLSTTRVFKSSGINGGQLILGFSKAYGFGLMIGKIFGEALNLIFIIWLLRKHISGNTPFKSSGILKEAKEYKKFPFVTSPHALLNTLSSNSPNFLFVSFFSTAVAGFYSLSYRVCFAPIQLISHSMYQVYSQDISERYNNGLELYQHSLRILRKISVYGFIPFLLLFFFAPSIIKILFGSDWTTAGEYIQFLVPYFYLSFITSPFSFVPLLLGKQEAAFSIEIINLILRVSAIYIGYIYGSVFLSLLLYSIVGTLIQSYLIVWFFSLLRR